jgi:hypothetical protein
MSAQVIKVFTPIKRVPTMIGKAQNGQKLPFGPYTLLQLGGGMAVLVVVAILTLSLPINPAITFAVGLIFTAVTVFLLRLVPYTGVRISSRIVWVGRIIFTRKPISASGMPITSDSARDAVFVDESIVLMLPDDLGGISG